MSASSDRYQLVQKEFDAHRLGRVDTWIEKQRRDGQSWVQVSFAIRALIGMDISYETLRRWSPEIVARERAAKVGAEDSE